MYCVINIPTMQFFTVFLCVKSLWLFFFSKRLRGKELYEVTKAEIESKSYTVKKVILLLQIIYIDQRDVFKILLKVKVIWHKKMK